MSSGGVAAAIGATVRERLNVPLLTRLIGWCRHSLHQLDKFLGKFRDLQLKMETRKNIRHILRKCILNFPEYVTFEFKNMG